MKLKLNLKLSVKIIFYILNFFCLVPYSVNLKTLNLNFSIKSFLWCVLFSLVLILVDPYFDEVVYKSLTLHDNHTGFVARIFTKGTHIMVLICVYYSIFNIKQVFKLVKLLKVVFEKLSKFGAPDFNECELILKQVLIKLLTIQILILFIHYVYAIHICDGSVLLIIFYTPITTLTYTIGSAMLLKFNVFVVILRIGFSKINEAICEINPQNSEIKDIDELAQIYFKLCEVSILILRMFQIPIMSFLGYFFILMENQFFNMFVSFAVETRNGILGIVCLFAFCVVRVFELVIVLQDMNLVVLKVNFFCLIN